MEEEKPKLPPRERERAKKRYTIDECRRFDNFCIFPLKKFARKLKLEIVHYSSVKDPGKKELT